jgi:ribose transport system ATP-binding protein
MHPAAISISHLTVRYGPTTALDAVDLEVAEGQVHALLGENGAGKSTIVKVLSGLVRPDSGTVTIFGRNVVRYGARSAHDLGIRTAFQEISLIKDLTVAQNFMLMEEPRNLLGMVKSRALDELVRERLEELGITSVDPRAEVRSLDLPSRQKVEIARAVSHRPRILLLDEPTSALSSRDVQWLGNLIERLARSGTTVVLISHRMQEVREFCSALTIFRNGRTVGAYAVADLADAEIIQLMIGRSLGAAFPPRPARAEERAKETETRGRPHPALSSRGLATAGGLSDVSFSLRSGEVLGLAGLDGMGQRELFMALFGIVPPTAGEICVAGEPIHLRSPADAIKGGIGMLPEDRKSEGLFLGLDARENVTLPSLTRFVRAGLVRASLEQKMVERALDVVNVAKRALWSPVRNFSGGNQQKIAVAKWLLTNTPVLLLYDPTRGIDVGTKTELYHLIRRYAENGGAVLFYSTEIPELVNLCDQVMVIYRGRIVETLAGDMLSEPAILNAAVGGRSASASGQRTVH